MLNKYQPIFMVNRNFTKFWLPYSCLCKVNFSTQGHKLLSHVWLRFIGNLKNMVASYSYCMLKQLYIAHNHKVLNTHGHLILTQRPTACCPETDYSYKLIQCAQSMNAPSLQLLGNCHVLLLEVANYTMKDGAFPSTCMQ